MVFRTHPATSCDPPGLTGGGGQTLGSGTFIRPESSGINLTSLRNRFARRFQK